MAKIPVGESLTREGDELILLSFYKFPLLPPLYKLLRVINKCNPVYKQRLNDRRRNNAVARTKNNFCQKNMGYTGVCLPLNDGCKKLLTSLLYGIYKPSFFFLGGGSGERFRGLLYINMFLE